MEPINMVAFKRLVDGERYDIVSDTLWSPVVKVLNVNLFVNTNDKYVILYNDDLEIHINCMIGVYKDNDAYIIERRNIFDNNIHERFKVIKHSY